MIIIKNIISYSKFLGIFILIELFISFIMGFINIIGSSTTITFIISLITNLIIFYIYGFINGKVTCKKGFIEGAITGSILIATLFLMALIFFTKSIGFVTIFYYVCLLISCMIGATVGKNKKPAEN